MHPLDHIMLATPALEAAVADFEQQTGVRPSEGGRHPGQGSRNVLATLGKGCYLEIIGPDLSQDRTNNLGEVLSRLTTPTLLKFAAGTRNIEAVHQRASKLGLWPLASSGARANGPFAMSRTLPTGEVLKWRLLLLGSGDYEGSVPFFIQWDSEPHPSQTAATGCGLERFWVEHPDVAGLAKLYSELEVAVDVLPAAQPRLNLSLQAPKGRVAF